VDSYLADVLTVMRPLPPRYLGVEEAEGAILAEDVAVRWPLPLFDNSAIDGYAVRACDIARTAPSAPVTLPVDGEVGAGDTHPRGLAAGTCVRIRPGALLPAGADAVVRVESASVRAGRVAISEAVRAGASVRRRGSEAQPGDLLLAAGTQLGARHVALLAAVGHCSVLARPRPRLTIISTGNELAEPGESLIPGQVWDSNSIMLAAAARHGGGVVRRHPIVSDNIHQVLAAVQETLSCADMLVTSGGVSMGAEHDVVKAALEKLGTVTFRKVAMQPGMPQGFGVVGSVGKPILTLPGNPVSAYVSFRLFAMPAMRALQDLPPEPAADTAVLTAPPLSPPGKRSFLSGILDTEARTVMPVTGRASRSLTALARSNALIIVPDQATAMAQGDTVEVLDLRA
jgi:molybdopterin molybdotransferase